MPTTLILRSRTVHPSPIGSNPNCIDKNNNLNSMQHTLHHPPIHPPPQQPLQTTTFHNNDVLMGRGGTINAHPGNEQYRKFVERKKRVYLTARFKREKRLIAQSIVDEIRALDPPGRFLLKDARESIWRDVGDEKARDKTSQALRENAGTVRKEMEEEYQETRRQQVRDNAIAMGKCPDEAVKNMMSVAQNAAAVAKHAEKSAKEKKPPAQEPALVAKSSYAVQPKSPPVTQQYTQQPPAPPPAPQQQPQAQGWGYHHQPPSHVQQSQQIIMQQHNTDPNYPYFVPPTMHSHPPHQQQVVHQPPQPQHHLQPGMQHQQMYGAPAPQQPAPSHSPEKEPDTQQVPNEQYKLFLEWQKSSDNSRSRTVKPQHTISQPIMPPPPPSAWEPTPISEMVANQSTLSPKTAAAASQIASTSPPIAAINLRPSTRTSSRDSSPGSDRHVQFQNDIPLMIDSKSGGGSSKIQPRVSMQQQQQQQQQHQQQGGGDNVYTDYIPDASMSQSGQSTSPRSHANMSQNMSQAGNTHATPLTFLSTDMSVKTSDSLNYYLQGLEDEISGDVGQEVELVAHAPMLDEQQHHNHHGRHHHHGGIPSYHNRSTPPRYGGGSGRSHGGSSHKSGSGNSRRSRRRRTGNHIPSNSGKVQLDLSNLGGPSPSGAPTFIGAPPQAPQQVHHQHHETVPTTAACGAACGDGGVILPTPLRSTQQPKHSPPSSAAMGPPAPLSSPGFNNNNAIAPLSPGSMVNSLDLDKMSLCGTENVSHAGGSIGGASLCNVFDDNDDSIIGSGNLMDMTMSLGSGGTIIGSQQTGKSPSTQSLQLGLHYAGGENESLIDMSVGSGGANSKMENSQNSGSGGSSSRSRRSGSPASIDKADVDNVSNKIAEIHQQFLDEAYQPPAGQQETPVPVYGQDFKFSWDSKREE